MTFEFGLFLQFAAEKLVTTVTSIVLYELVVLMMSKFRWLCYSNRMLYFSFDNLFDNDNTVLYSLKTKIIDLPSNEIFFRVKIIADQLLTYIVFTGMINDFCHHDLQLV